MTRKSEYKCRLLCAVYGAGDGKDEGEAVLGNMVGGHKAGERYIIIVFGGKTRNY